MKIELLKTQDGYIKGWDVIPENKKEKEILGSIRNAIFFGLTDNGTYPKYNGRESEIIEENGEYSEYVTKLMWRIPKYDKK